MAVDAAIFMNRVCFNGCIFRRVNYILSAYIYCGVSFISCDIERVHLFNRMSKAWGVSFSGCYIESNYTDNKEDAFIVINSPFTGCVDFYNCFIQATRYVVFEKDDISMDFSIPRGVIKFTDCALLGHTSFDLFWLGNKHCVFVELNGPKAIIGKWNEKYSNITQFASLSDIVNRPNCVINNVQAYQYMQGKFVNSRLVPSSGSTSQRPKGIGAKNSEGVIDTTFGVGFVYFDTTLGKPIYVKEVSGNGTITWVDAAGQKV